MYKLKGLSALVFILVMIACSDDDPKPSFTQSDFYGTWQVNGSQPPCIDAIKIDETMFYFGLNCSGTLSFDNGYIYTYQNNTIAFSVDGVDVKYVFKSRTDRTFKAEVYTGSTAMGTTYCTKI